MGVSLKFNMPSITPKFMFRLLVLVFWSQHTILKFATEFLERLPFFSRFSGYIVPFLFISLFLLSWPHIIRQVRIPDILFVLSIVLVVVMTLLIYPDSSSYINVELWRIFGLAVPLYFVGVIYDHEETKRDLYWASLIGVVAMFVYQLYKLGTGRELEEDGMNASYNTLPSIMYLIYWAIANKGIKNWFVALSASAVSFVFGTRGPILAIIIFLSIGTIYKVLKIKNVAVKIVIILAIFVSVTYIVSGDTLVTLAVYLSEKFEEIGFSTRIFDFFIEEQLAESEGREKISEVVILAIKQKPLLGYGFMGDRFVTGGPYAHNIILEFLCSFGVLFGGIASVLSIAVPLVAITRFRGTNISWMLTMLVCMMFVKLFVSSSYVFEANFFLLLGVSVNILRLAKLKASDVSFTDEKVYKNVDSEV